MHSVLILVREKIVYIQFEEILEQGNLVITNILGDKVFEEKISDTNYKAITLDQPAGKYRLEIYTDTSNIKKTFHIK